MRIAILGTGNVGTTLGRAWARAGHAIVYGSRSPGEHGALADHAEVKTTRDAVAGADAIVLATSWGGVEPTLAAAGDLGGRPLLDLTNPIGPGFALALGHTTSGGEHVAALAPTGKVVKVLNSTGVENMASPRFGAHRAVMFLAGDDAGARDVATALVSDLGFEPVALPALARARELEPLAMLWIKLALQLGMGRGFAFGIARRDAEPGDVPVPRTPHPRSIVIAGSGHIGGALARAWLRAGHAVTIATRSPESDEVGGLRSAGAAIVAVDGAAKDADVVVLAVPAGAAKAVVDQLAPAPGTIVVDCTNAIGAGMSLVHGWSTSSAEELARALPGLRVVRAFHQQGAEILVDPRFGDQRAAAFVAADDDDARAVVLELARDVGLDAIATGPLAMARYLEPMTLLWIHASRPLGTREYAITVLRR